MGYYDPELTPEGIRAKKQQEQIEQAEQNDENKNRDEIINDMRKGKFANKEGDTEIAQINREDIEQGIDVNNKDNKNEFDSEDKVNLENEDNVDTNEVKNKMENNEVPSIDEEAALLEEEETEDKPKGRKSKSGK